MGDTLLSQASLDLSGVRTHVRDDEVLNAIRDGNAKAAPGSNGVSGKPYHLYAILLVPVFLEAFEDLVHGHAMPFSERILIAIGKMPNTSHLDKVRDIELPNFDHKVMERLVCLVLDEAVRGSLSRAQCARVTGRDAAMHVVKFSLLFERAVRLQELMLTLSLDCSKGFNRLGHSWIRRVLIAAGCPGQLVDAIMRLV